MKRHRFLFHSSLAAVAALASVGVWFLWSSHTTLPPWVGIPLTAKVIFITLAVIAHLTRAHAYSEGIAHAQIDPVTRLPSQAVANQVLALEFAAAERGRDLVVVLFSIDNYRRLAPLEGGSIGEKLMLGAGAVLRRRTRGMNVSARRTEDGQFISVLSGASVEGARTFTSRVRKDLASLKVGAIPPIVSAAICAYEAGMHSVDELMFKAEDGLAKARKSGSGYLAVTSEPTMDLEFVRP